MPETAREEAEALAARIDRALVDYDAAVDMAWPVTAQSQALLAGLLREARALLSDPEPYRCRCCGLRVPGESGMPEHWVYDPRPEFGDAETRRRDVFNEMRAIDDALAVPVEEDNR